MGINKFLYDILREDKYHWDAYAFEEKELSQNLENFLACSAFEERNMYALNILKKILDVQHRKPFFKVLKYILDIEEGVQKYNPQLRDHVTHAVYVYLLGSVCVKKFPRLVCTRDLRFEFKWKLASLLHDLGNPIHLFLHSLTKYIKIVEEVGKISSSIKYSIEFDGIADLIPRIDKESNSFNLIQERLNAWNIEIDIKKTYDEKLSIGQIEHGIFSALLVLKTLDGLYGFHNLNHIKTECRREGVDWGRNHFDREIIDAATAISIHNLVPIINHDIEYTNSPLAFLLVFCDTLQEWDRFSQGQRVYDPFSVDISFFGNIPNIRLQLPDYKIQEIENILKKLKINGNNINIRNYI